MLGGTSPGTKKLAGAICSSTPQHIHMATCRNQCSTHIDYRAGLHQALPPCTLANPSNPCLSPVFVGALPQRLLQTLPSPPLLTHVFQSLYPTGSGGSGRPCGSPRCTLLKLCTLPWLRTRHYPQQAKRASKDKAVRTQQLGASNIHNFS